MASETCTPKRTKPKINDSSKPSLLSKKVINKEKRHQIELNPQSLKLHSAQRIQTNTLRFNGNPEVDWYGHYTNDETLKKLTKTIKPISKIQQLDLDFNWCKQITDGGLHYISEAIKHKTALKNININLEECRQMTETGLSYLANTLKRLAGLQSLNLSLICTQMADKGIYRLARSLKSLVSLQNINLGFRL